MSIPKGSRFGRYVVTAPAAKSPNGGRRRVWVECVCGFRRRILERDLVIGRSTGCPSGRCREAWKAEEARREERDLTLRDAIDELAELCPGGSIELAASRVLRAGKLGNIDPDRKGKTPRAAVLHERTRRAVLLAQEATRSRDPDGFTEAVKRALQLDTPVPTPAPLPAPKPPSRNPRENDTQLHLFTPNSQFT